MRRSCSAPSTRRRTRSSTPTSGRPWAVGPAQRSPASTRLICLSMYDVIEVLGEAAAEVGRHLAAVGLEVDRVGPEVPDGRRVVHQPLQLDPDGVELLLGGARILADTVGVHANDGHADLLVGAVFNFPRPPV